MSNPTTSTQSPTTHPIAADRRASHQQWLLEVTQLPTAAGKEQRVIAWIDQWLSNRDSLSKHTDPHGNFEIRIVGIPESDHPIYFTAHLDHPAFVVEEVASETQLVLSFRGGVMADYFPDAKVRLHCSDTCFTMGTIGEEIKATNDKGEAESLKPFKRYTCTLDESAAIEPGTIGTWDLPDAKIVEDEFGGIIHTNACDDLAAVAAALSAIDELAQLKADGTVIGDVRVLFTRAEEVGFIGAIGASRDGFMPKGSRIIALENSRAFPDSPIHGGPIVRVGDRISIFSPELTGAIAKVAERIAGGPASPTASQKISEMPTWKWQRKLMAGGACEASVYCAYGYCSTCVCLPLGNYHNMAGLAEAQAGTHEGTPRVGCEFVGLDDYAGMVDLLVGCGIDLPSSPGFVERVEKLWVDTRFVLDSK
jgi:putative aminopeptidase FrvX